jgi:hypothetical protein
MSYLNAYGKKRRFQEGGVAAAPVQAGPEQVVDKRKKFLH